MNKKQLILLILILFSLNGCALLIAGAGVGVVASASDTNYKQIELETKEEYGKYKLEMQKNNIEPILTYEEWLRKQVEDPKKAERWSRILNKIEKDHK